jgi:hypothetical protein
VELTAENGERGRGGREQWLIAGAKSHPLSEYRHTVTVVRNTHTILGCRGKVRLVSQDGKNGRSGAEGANSGDGVIFAIAATTTHALGIRTYRRVYTYGQYELLW